MGTNRKRKIRFIKQIVILFAIIAIGASALLLYVRYYDSGSLACGRFLTPSNQKSARLCFEIADTEGERAKGLMYRKAGELANDGGMIFVYEEEAAHSFWMKNTFILLDMIFLDSDFKVVGIIENAAPLSENPRKIDSPSRYIVEINGGLAKKFGIQAGAKLQLERQLPRAF